MKTKQEIQDMLDRLDSLSADEQKDLRDHIRALQLANEMLGELARTQSGTTSIPKQASYGKR